MALCRIFVFFFNETATTEIYTLSLHDALPISVPGVISPSTRCEPISFCATFIPIQIASCLAGRKGPRLAARGGPRQDRATPAAPGPGVAHGQVVKEKRSS